MWFKVIFEKGVRVKNLCLAVMVGLFLFPSTFGVGLAQESGRREFYDIENLKRLIDLAREAEFSDEELGMNGNYEGIKSKSECQLQKMTLWDGSRCISVVAYIAEQERNKLLQAEEAKRLMGKKYLTVQDILNELLLDEPAKLAQFRDELFISDQ